MKKYLIKGTLALFTGAFLFSCADKETDYVPIVQQKVKTYEEVFNEVYGEIDPYQNWGFTNDLSLADSSTTEVIYKDSLVTESELAGTRAGTRGHNANANEWGRSYSNVPDPLTDEQKKRVRLYFQYNKDPQNEPVSYTNFFVQDVYKGGSNPLWKNENGFRDFSKEAYNFGGELQIGSDHMDKLTAGRSNDHINNYNNAHCSTNENVWDGRTYQEGYPLDEESAAAKGIGDWEAENYNHVVYHSDEIMLMVGSSTACFGWFESNGSIQQNDNYVIISGETIDRWADQYPGADLGASVAGRGFVGFDYDARVDADDVLQDPHGWDEAAWDEQAWDEYVGWDEEKQENIIIHHDAVHHDAVHHDGPRTNEDGIPYVSSGAYDNQASVTVVPAGTPGALPVWERYVNGDQSQGNVWVKIGCADGYYSDWIICIVKAEPKEITRREKMEKYGTEEKTPFPGQCGRIFCEDLGVSSREDLDFNDLVLDVDIYQNIEEGVKKYYWVYSDGRKEFIREEPYSNRSNPTYSIEMTLLAAGGTIPLTVAGMEVHDKFDVGITTMVNTYNENSTVFGSVEDRDPVYLGSFTPSQLFPATEENPGRADTDPVYVHEIPIAVKWGNDVALLGSSLGGAPAKIFVPNHTTKWTVERKPLTVAYPRFADYVGNKNIQWWDDNLLTDAEKASVGYYRYGNATYSGRVTPPIVITRITYPWASQDIMWPSAGTSSVKPYTDWSVDFLPLDFDLYYPGDRITFFVEDLKDDSYITVVFADGNKPYFIDTMIPNYDLDAQGNKINKGKTSTVIEVELDEANAKKMNSSKRDGRPALQVMGRNFTLTQISRTLFQ